MHWNSGRVGVGLVLGVAALTCGATTAADPLAPPSPEKKAAVRVFIGSFQVAAEQRARLMETLQRHGFTGSFVPEDAAADTLLYRGPKADYDAAVDLIWKVRLEAKAPEDKPPTPRKEEPAKKQDDKANADADAIDKLGLSPLQRELCKEWLGEGDRRMQEFKENPRPTPEMMKKGTDFNRWKMTTLRAILTRDQYAGYYKAFGPTAKEADLGPAPALEPVDPKAEKTDDAIFARLSLSDKQKEYVDQHRAWLKKATEEMKKLASGHIEAGGKINQKWRSGLDRILTMDQRKQYADYWGPAPDRILP